MAKKIRCAIKRSSDLVLFSFLIVMFAAKPAHAYLDPGTGSMILQLLLGGVAGGLMVGKLYFRKIRSFFSGLLAGQTRDDNHADDA